MVVEVDLVKLAVGLLVSGLVGAIAAAVLVLCASREARKRRDAWQQYTQELRAANDWRGRRGAWERYVQKLRHIH